MKKELSTEIEIPKGVEASFDGEVLTIRGPEGENKKNLKLGKLNLDIKKGSIILGNKKSTKVEKKIMNTNRAHIKNMIKGVQKKFEYKLKVCSGHFPFTLKQEGNKVMIKNFLGEKKERIARIPEGADVEIKKDIITIKSLDKEVAGQAAANFETATRVKGRDIRIFQDGIYITEKDGKKI